MKSFEPEQFNEGFVVTHPLNGKPLASQKYKITLDDGQVIEGLTDEKGMTSLTKSQAAQDMVISLLDGE